MNMAAFGVVALESKMAIVHMVDVLSDLETMKDTTRFGHDWF